MMSSEAKALPQGWVECELGEVCTIYQPTTISAKEMKSDGRYLVFGANGIIGKYDSFNHEEPQILVTCRGATCGTVNVSPPNCWITGNSMVVMPFSVSEIHKFFLKYFLKSEINLSNVISGTAQPQITRANLAPQTFYFPPLNEQKRIVAKIETLFSEIDKGVEELKTAQAKAKQYRQALLKHAFSGQLTADWRAENTRHSEAQAEESPSPLLRHVERSEESPSPLLRHVERSETSPQMSRGILRCTQDDGLPVGWEEKPLGKLADIIGGYAFKSASFKTQGVYQVIKIGNLRPGVIRYNEKPAFIDTEDESILKRFSLNLFDVLISLTGTRNKRDYGFTALVNKNNLLLNQRVAAIRFNESIQPKFFLFFSWTETFKRQFFESETGNTGQGNVSQTAIRFIKTPSPSLPEQEEIVRRLEVQFSVLDALETDLATNLQKAETLKQAILKKAFAGELVSQDPTDEPASELLKRIQAEKAMQVKTPKTPRKKKATTV